MPVHTFTGNKTEDGWLNLQLHVIFMEAIFQASITRGQDLGHVHACESMWRSEAMSGIILNSIFDVILFWRKRSLTEPGVINFANTVGQWTPGIRWFLSHLSWSCRTKSLHGDFAWVLGSKSGSLHLCCRHFPNKAISPAPRELL